VTEEQFKQLLEALKGVSSGGRRPTGPRVQRDDSEGAENKAITDEIERQNKAYQEQEEIIKKLEKEYSNLTQGITRKYKLEEAKAIRDHSAAMKQLAIDLENGTKSQEQYNTAVEQATEKMEAAREAAAGQKGMSDALTRVATSATGLTLKSGSLTEKMVNLGNQLNKGASQGGSMKVAMGDMMKSMGKAGLLKAVELLAAGFKAFAKLTTDFIFDQDKAISSFRKATGASKEYNLQIAAVSVEARRAGVTASEQGKAFEELYTSMSSFTELSKSEQSDLAETTSLLGKMGISSSTTAKIFDQMTRTLGKSATGAKNVILDLAGAAKSIGVPMGKMTQDFAASFGELSKFGDNAMEVFKDLSVQSKKTGIEVSRLMSITKKFDTFDGAATAVGKLNAILGGPYLNSIDMLNASESERIEQIRTTLQLSGQQFEALNRFEKMAIADALGMSVEETGRLMKMSTAEMQMQALEAAEVAERAAEMQTMMEQIKSAFTTLALDMRPVVEDVIMPMINGFANFIEGWGKAQSGASAFGNTMKYVSTIMASMMIPLAALVMIGTGGIGWPVAVAMLAAAGVSLGIGALAGSAVQGAVDSVAETTAAGADSRAARKAKGKSDGGFALESVHAADYVFASQAQGPSVRVNMNEFGPEGAILPDGTYVATATDMKESIAASKLVAQEIAGLRADLKRASGQSVQLMVEDGREFAAHIVNSAGLSPFLV
jgi:hypothetical protein